MLSSVDSMQVRDALGVLSSVDSMQVRELWVCYLQWIASSASEDALGASK